MSLAVTFTTIVEMFDNITAKYATSKRPFLMQKVAGTYQPISYTDFRERVTLFAHGLVELGLKPGDRIAILSENRPEWAIADLGILCGGGIDVPLYPTLTAKQIEYVLNDAGRGNRPVQCFSLNKVLKIRQDVRSLKHIIVMKTKDAREDANVISFEAVLEQGLALFRIINITADRTFKFFHTNLPFTPCLPSPLEGEGKGGGGGCFFILKICSTDV